MKRKEIVERATKLTYGKVYNRLEPADQEFLQKDVEAMLEDMGFFDLLGSAEALVKHLPYSDIETYCLATKTRKAISKINGEGQPNPPVK